MQLQTVASACLNIASQMNAFNFQNTILSESQDNYGTYKKVIHSQGLIAQGPASCVASTSFKHVCH